MSDYAHSVPVLRLFAQARVAAGTGRAVFAGATPVAVLEAASAEFGPSFAATLPYCTIWVNGEPVAEDFPLTDVDEVAVCPPVSGGN